MTAFTVTIEAREGVSTGISAADRAHTVRVAVSKDAKVGDVVSPGHIFPLIAREGGVLLRSGHTEAAVDLCKLAGLPPVGVICELANDDGTVMKGPQIDTFAEQHSLKRVSVADLIAYVNHDIDDAVRAGVLRTDDLPLQVLALQYMGTCAHAQGH